jgi:hypothetical protein
MAKLKLYYPVNSYVLNLNRDHTRFFLDLINKLKQTHEVIVEPENIDAHRGGVTFNLETDSNTTQHVFDCEMLIENLENGEFYILSAHDHLSVSTLGNKENPKLKKVLFSQFIPNEVKHHTRNNYYKYSPWIYFKQDNLDLEIYYEKRKFIEDKIDTLFFRGSYADRPILQHINSNILPLGSVTNNVRYFEDLIKHKVALSVGGASTGDLCYRDIEYMQLGIPFIKFQYISYLDNPLIPNYHYISIDLPEDLPIHNDVIKDRLGLKHHAQMIEKRYYEVINDLDFLKMVGENSRNYFLENLSYDVRINKTIKALNL